MPLPLKDTEYIFYIGLGNSANPDEFLVNPTIETGDFKVSIDGGALANLNTLPVVAPSGSVMVKVTLSAAEMDGDKVNVVAVDVADDEWQDAIISIDVPTGNVETLTDLDEGDRIETSTRLLINKAGTSTPILDKTISGSLLQNNVIITTEDT